MNTPNLPLRLTVRVVIRKGNKVCLMVKKKDGVVQYCSMPGGGVEEGSTLLLSAVEECLEEVGILIRNVKPLGVNIARQHPMPKAERSDTWGGTDTHYVVADFVRMNSSKLNIEGDALPYVWVEIPEAIRMIEESPPSDFNPTKIEALKATLALSSSGAGKRPPSQRW